MGVHTGRVRSGDAYWDDIVRTSHSSLLADTGLSEIELDRIGATPTKRLLYYSSPSTTKLFDLGPFMDTLSPFREWFEDEDVLMFQSYEAVRIAFERAVKGDFRGRSPHGKNRKV